MLVGHSHSQGLSGLSHMYGLGVPISHGSGLASSWTAGGDGTLGSPWTHQGGSGLLGAMGLGQSTVKGLFTGDAPWWAYATALGTTGLGTGIGYVKYGSVGAAALGGGIGLATSLLGLFIYDKF